jgi:hypothetical protein
VLSCSFISTICEVQALTPLPSHWTSLSSVNEACYSICHCVVSTLILFFHEKYFLKKIVIFFAANASEIQPSTLVLFRTVALSFFQLSFLTIHPPELCMSRYQGSPREMHQQMLHTIHKSRWKLFFISHTRTPISFTSFYISFFEISLAHICL